MSTNSKILDAQPISEREDKLLRAARKAMRAHKERRVLHHQTASDCLACALFQIETAIAAYKDRP